VQTDRHAWDALLLSGIIKIASKGVRDYVAFNPLFKPVIRKWSRELGYLGDESSQRSESEENGIVTTTKPIRSASGDQPIPFKIAEQPPYYKDFDYFKEIGNDALMSKNFTIAFDYFNKALKAAQDNRDVSLTRQINKIINDAKISKTKFEVSSIADKAKSVADSGRYSEAIEILNDAVKIASDNNLTQEMDNLEQLLNDWKFMLEKNKAMSRLENNIKAIAKYLNEFNVEPAYDLINKSRSLIEQFQLDPTQLDSLILKYREIIDSRDKIQREITDLVANIRSKLGNLDFNSAGNSLQSFKSQLNDAVNKGVKLKLDILDAKNLLEDVNRQLDVYKNQIELLNKVDNAVQNRDKAAGLNYLTELKRTSKNVSWDISPWIDDRKNALDKIISYKDYHGVKLYEEDADVLYELEQIVKAEIPVVLKIKWNTFGYNHSNYRVTRLSLYNKGLTSLPESIGNLTNLEKLYLHKNQLSSIPESIGNLKNLKELDLKENQLSSIPESIGNLINLTSLALGGDQLSSLPEIITKMTWLKVLVIQQTDLSFLPKSIGNLKNLKYLNLRENNLSSIPESIGNLKNLTLLNLAGNKLSSIPKSIGNLKNLTELYLYKNQLSSIPKSIGNLKNLEKLRLESNKLSSIPKSIGNLKNLKFLDLGSNNLSSLPDSINNLNNLTYLSLWNNDLLSHPNKIQKQLRKLSSHCPISGLPHFGKKYVQKKT
ncbi:MAG: leucine-rich repeat domain-containing protein, partial [Promethearchaeota archaeon]